MRDENKEIENYANQPKTMYQENKLHFTLQ